MAQKKITRPHLHKRAQNVSGAEKGYGGCGGVSLLRWCGTGACTQPLSAANALSSLRRVPTALMGMSRRSSSVSEGSVAKSTSLSSKMGAYLPKPMPSNHSPTSADASGPNGPDALNLARRSRAASTKTLPGVSRSGRSAKPAAASPSPEVGGPFFRVMARSGSFFPLAPFPPDPGWPFTAAPRGGCPRRFFSSPSPPSTSIISGALAFAGGDVA
mmetsp:Transcript_17796/g.58225  ORF Transcript_17796/g.58225 Transcript_17796/m.58225 type:complete len:215 (-) Transcript_17796:358-1002(-)